MCLMGVYREVYYELKLEGVLGLFSLKLIMLIIVTVFWNVVVLAG